MSALQSAEAHQSPGNSKSDSCDSRMLSCQACGDACQSDSPSCPGCKALYYCSLDHMRLHVQHAHGPDECRRMAEQVERAQVTQLQ